MIAVSSARRVLGRAVRAPRLAALALAALAGTLATLGLLVVVPPWYARSPDVLLLRLLAIACVPGIPLLGLAAASFVAAAIRGTDGFA